MIKHKPFKFFLILTVLSILAFLSSFAVSAYIDSKFESKIPILSTVEVTSDGTFAKYIYENEEYSSIIPHSSALKDGMSLPVYIDPSSPETAELKDVSSVLVLKFVSGLVFAVSFTECIVLYVRYKLKERK